MTAQNQNAIEVTPKQAARILAACWTMDHTVCLWGPPGVGKSQSVHQAAQANGYRVIEVRAALMDTVDFMGMPTVVNGVTHFARPAFFPAEDDETPTVIFLDELNRASTAVMNAGFQFLDQRRVGEHKVNRNTRVVAACNRETDGGGVTRMAAALSLRFTHITMKAEPAEFSEWAAGHGIDPLVIGFLRYKPALLHDFAPAERVSPNPRSWEFVSKLCASGMGSDDLLPTIAGTVGYGPAIEFLAFRDLLKNLPNLDAILMNPGQAPVPTAVDQLYAVSSALSGRATDDNFDRVVTYLDRCPIEYAAYSIRDAVTRAPSLAATEAFIGWAVQHQDVIG